jgi:hypothetical protein
MQKKRYGFGVWLCLRRSKKSEEKLSTAVILLQKEKIKQAMRNYN